MQKRKKPVIYSEQFIQDITDIYFFGLETFGINQAEKYESFILRMTDGLKYDYEMYPECRFLVTKGKIYRNIIFESHIIVYRIKKDTVEILRIFHTSTSNTTKRTARNIR